MAGMIAAGGTLGATAAGTITQGNIALASATTTVATISGTGVRLYSRTGNATQGGDGLVAATQGTTIDPLGYPIRVQAPNGTNSFSVFGSKASVAAGGGYVVFCPVCDINTPVADFVVPAAPSLPAASVGTPGAINAKGPAPEGPARRMPPMGMCEAADIAGAVLYFASPVARRCTNQVLCVDGGFTVS